MTTQIVPDPAAVAAWRRTIQIEVGCVRTVPDAADPYAVAAYNEAVRQLEAEARTRTAEAEPEPGL